MDDSHNILQIRLKLYEEVWSEPMTLVATRYNVSDNGLRKRCKALNIPLPPAGYWAKVKAGKSVPGRPHLPPTIYSGSNKTDISDESKAQKMKIASGLHLIELEELTIDQLNNMHDFDLLSPGSLEAFSNWCDSLAVPGKIHYYHPLILKYQAEMKFRENRDKEHPFRENGIRIWNPIEKVKYRDNEAVIPINVSSQQLNRAYRIVDTILKSFQEINARCSVENSKNDNVAITLLSTSLSFVLIEKKTKRRNIRQQDLLKDLRPAYEEVYDGRFQIDWTAHKNGYYYSSNKSAPVFLSYADSDDYLLESQISGMIFNLYRLCCNNEIINGREQKERSIKFEEERCRQSEQDQADKRLKLEERRKTQKELIISELPKHADNWFKCNQLLKFADELEDYLVNCQSDDMVNLLQKYIKFVRENANGCNPISSIIEEMRSIESPDEN